jgi:23S rRNA (cytosine1962-C5)-methyltransferase
VTRLVLRAQREARIRGGHPWIYRTDVARLDGSWRDDEAVTVVTADGRVLGRGFYNPRPQIVCRLLTRRDEPVDDALFRRRLAAAWAFRATLGYDGDAGRVLFGEGDLLPGLIVDRYGEVLALQALTRGMAAHAGRVAALAAEVTGARAVYRRGDPTAAAIEGFDDASGWLVGEGETELEIREGPCRFRLDLEGGQKTGFYLDQRENREEIARRAAGRRVLDAFAYTGGFAAWALRSGARAVLAVDSSAAARRIGRWAGRRTGKSWRPTPSMPSASSSGTAGGSISSCWTRRRSPAAGRPSTRRSAATRRSIFARSGASRRAGFSRPSRARTT